MERLRFDRAVLHLAGSRGKVRVDLAQPVLLVGGQLDTTLFGHLYAGGSDEPFEFTERAIIDWQFLGVEAGLIGPANFQRTLERIRAHSGVTWNDSLMRHAAVVKDCTAAIAGDGAHVLSRVLFHSWRTERGFDLAELEPALAVVSTAPEPPERVTDTSASIRRSRRVAPPPEEARVHRSAEASALPRRAADGTVSCGPCRQRRVVNEFGRCLVCGNAIALAEVRNPSALTWFLKQHPRIATAFVIVCAVIVAALATRVVGAHP